MPARNEGKGILVLGLGELGTAIINAFMSHAEEYKHEESPISVMIRPQTITAPPTAEKAAQLTALSSQGVTFIGGNVETSNAGELTRLFSPYHTIIHAGAMTVEPGTQLKVTKAVLATGTNRLYIPWQFGVDYDAIGREGGQGMFSEQLDVRDLLRAQSEVQWLIISCGIFMNFLFEEFWGVVVGGGSSTGAKADETGSAMGQNQRQTHFTKLHALGSWDDLLTVTTAEDIGRCTADIVLRRGNELSSSPPSPLTQRNQSVYIAGDTMKYHEFASLLDEVNGVKVERELWTTDFLAEESVKDPGNQLKKYRVVFSEGKGLAWPKEGTYNDKVGMSMTGIKAYLQNKNNVS